MTREPTEHDFTNGYWSHNIDILNWDREKKEGRAVCWVTPGLKNGDIVIVKSERGTMRLIASDVEWQSNVNDMYIFTIKPEGMPEEDDEGEWVCKVRRYGGGTSILDVASTKAQAQALADEFNTQYQTDNYYIERYDPERHAYSRHG